MGSGSGSLAGSVVNFSRAKKASRDLSSLSMDQLQGHLQGLSGMNKSLLNRRGGRGLTSMFTNEINRRKALQQTQGMQGVNDNISGLGERVSNLEADIQELQGGDSGDAVAEGITPPPNPAPLPEATAPVNTGMPGQQRAYKRPSFSPFGPQAGLTMQSIYGTEEQRNKSIKR
tara:strand:+ start:1882 stop:2400 length:519 start_codon:yes stop_codon:yes gene_type:complete